MVFTILTSLPTASITQLKQLCCISMIISSMPSDHRSCHVFASLICLPFSTPLTIFRAYFFLWCSSRVCSQYSTFCHVYHPTQHPTHFLTFSKTIPLPMTLNFFYSILVTLTQVSSTFKPLCSPGCLQIFLLLTQKTKFLIIGLRKQLPIDNS